jgi:hypothetical protein
MARSDGPKPAQRTHSDFGALHIEPELLDRPN